jgi:hypothetical protein
MVLKATRDSDDTAWARYFELEIDIARDCHEFGVAGSLEDSMVRTLDVYDFKGECLLVGSVPSHRT